MFMFWLTVLVHSMATVICSKQRKQRSYTSLKSKIYHWWNFVPFQWFLVKLKRDKIMNIPLHFYFTSYIRYKTIKISSQKFQFHRKISSLKLIILKRLNLLNQNDSVQYITSSQLSFKFQLPSWYIFFFN